MDKILIYSLSLIGQIGLVTALPLVFFAFIGRFLDNKFGTGPYLFLAGLLIATVLVYFAVKQTVSKALIMFDKINDKK